MQHPSASGDDGASPAIRIGLPLAAAVVVGLAAAVARHAVSLQRVVAYVPPPVRGEDSSDGVRLHLSLLLLVADALADAGLASREAAVAGSAAPVAHRNGGGFRGRRRRRVGEEEEREEEREEGDEPESHWDREEEGDVGFNW